MSDSIITKVARFGNDSSKCHCLWRANVPNTHLAGLEKILRLLQSLCMITAAYLLQSSPSGAAPFQQGIKSLAVGRRYLRFFKLFPLLDTFWTVSEKGSAKGRNQIVHLLEMGKVGFGALYLIGQNVTMLDAMGVWKVEWAGMVMMEANRFWFYSLACACMLTLHGLWNLPSFPAPVEVEKGDSFEERTKAGLEKRKAVELAAKNGERRKRLVKDLVMYGADLFIPGDLTGWMRTEQWWVGSAMAVSTLLASEEVWEKVN